MPYKDPNKAKAYYAEYYAKRKEEKVAYQKAYYAKHKDEITAYKVVHYAANREQAIARTATWKRDNPERVATNHAARRSHEALPKDERAVSTEHRKKIKDDRCYYCEQHTETMHYDHVLPLSRGGTDHYWNIVRACSVCNLRKGSKTDLEYLATMETR